MFHYETLSFTGPQTIAMLAGLRINKLFLTSGFLIPDGLSTEDREAIERCDVQVMQASVQEPA